MNTEATYDELDIKRKIYERDLGLTDQEIPTCPGINGYLGNEQYQAIYDYTIRISRDNNIAPPLHWELVES